MGSSFVLNPNTGDIDRKISPFVFCYTVCILELVKVNNRNTKTRCEICSKLTIKTLERRQLCYSGVFIVNFRYILHVVLVFLLLNLSKQMPAWIT